MARGRRGRAFEQQRKIRRSIILGDDRQHTPNVRKMAPAQRKWELAPDEMVRAVGLEPTADGLKVRTGAQVKGSPPMSALFVQSVLPVLPPHPSPTVAGRRAAIVHPARPSRPGCRRGCRQIPRRGSVGHLAAAGP